MTNLTESILVLTLLSVLLSLGSTRLISLVKIMALQGVMVSLTLLLLRGNEPLSSGAIIFFQVTIFIKGLLIPGLLLYGREKNHH
jgi:hydrogenase-4 component E